jgi:hypothetical protein
MAGDSYESVMRARKILWVVHWVLGILSAMSLWSLVPAQGLNIATSGSGLLKVVQTILGWAPYAISGFYAPSLLDGNYRGVIAFAIGAVAITGLSVCFYLNLFSLSQKPSLILISVGVAISLIALARLCQMIWHTSANRVTTR